MLIRDVYRALRASPVLTASAVISLALGIGGTTAIFSILNSLLLKPLPVEDPRELVLVSDGGQNPYFALSYPVWKELRARRIFDRSFAWATERVNVAANGETRAAAAVWATGEIFEVLGVRPVLGRALTAADDVRNGGAAGPVAVISHAFWQRRFNGAGDVIGRTVSVDRIPFTVVGVMPPQFSGVNVGDRFDVMLPLEAEPLLGRMPPRLDSPAWTWLQVMARRGPGQTAASLSAVLNAAQPSIREATMPAFDHAEDRERYFAAPWMVKDAPGGFSRLRRQYAPALVTLFRVVGVALLIVAANIATLMLSKSAGRRHELSVRLALGASRRDLIRQLFAEHLAISILGAVCGLIVAHWGGRFLVDQLATWYSAPFLDLSLDWRVLGVMTAMTLVTALLCSLVPIYGALRVPAIASLRESRSETPPLAIRIGGGLVILQIALSLILVVTAGLFLRSFAALAYRDIGFDRNRVVVAVVNLPPKELRSASGTALYDRVREAALGVRGVESAALSLATPLGNAGVRFTPDIAVPGSEASGGATARILTNPVSPGWFRTYGTRFVAGRDFRENDVPGAPDVAIVNEAFARAYFGGESPLGRALLESMSATERRSLEIVGVVEDAAFATVRDRIEPTIYRPLAQRLDSRLLASLSTVSVSIRSAADIPPSRLVSALTETIGRIDRDDAVTFQIVSEQLAPSYIRERLLAMLSAFFGGLTLLLAAIGLYGATAYSVSQRRFELGVRVALGASPGRIIGMVFGRVSLLVTAGLLVGILGSLAVTRYIAALLYGMTPHDPATIGAAALIMAAFATTAAALPARRAARTDPAAVLRGV
jgi:predicted permease